LLTITVAVVELPVLSVYVMVALPAFTPVTVAVVLLPDTVAIDTSLDCHGEEEADVPDPVTLMVDPTATEKVVPVITHAAMLYCRSVKHTQNKPKTLLLTILHINLSNR
jgi:hypothetical protein